ncbi:TPA: hypothetical protein I0H53_RS13175 [Enterococcus faecalis]|nr:hypothetical protein [Enterococcus faecalis]
MGFLAKKMRLFEKGGTYEAYVRDIFVVFLGWLMVFIFCMCSLYVYFIFFDLVSSLIIGTIICVFLYGKVTESVVFVQEHYAKMAVKKINIVSKEYLYDMPEICYGELSLDNKPNSIRYKVVTEVDKLGGLVEIETTGKVKKQDYIEIRRIILGDSVFLKGEIVERVNAVIDRRSVTTPYVIEEREEFEDKRLYKAVKSYATLATTYRFYVGCEEVLF